MEGRYVAVINRRAPYLRKKDLQKELGLCRSTVDKLVRGVEDGISSGRYDRYSIAGSYINFYAVIDYLKYGEMLRDTNMRKHVPRYSPELIAESCGYVTKLVEVEKNVGSSINPDPVNDHWVPDGSHGRGWRKQEHAD